MSEQKSNLIEKKLLQYSAAAATVILMAGSADAQIWNSGEIDKTMADSDTARITYEGTHYLI